MLLTAQHSTYSSGRCCAHYRHPRAHLLRHDTSRQTDPLHTVLAQFCSFPLPFYLLPISACTNHATTIPNMPPQIIHTKTRNVYITSDGLPPNGGRPPQPGDTYFCLPSTTSRQQASSSSAQQTAYSPFSQSPNANASPHQWPPPRYVYRTPQPQQGSSPQQGFGVQEIRYRTADGGPPNGGKPPAHGEAVRGVTGWDVRYGRGGR